MRDSTHALVAKVQKQTRHHQSHNSEGTDAQGASLVETLSECSLFSLAQDRPRPRIYLPPHAGISCGLHGPRWVPEVLSTMKHWFVDDDSDRADANQCLAISKRTAG
jgi:hypothetical protein